MLAGVVLAGGKSSRMGTDKSELVMPLTSYSLLEHQSRLLSGLDDIEIFVSGKNQRDSVVDIVPECGPLSGIHAMLTHLSKTKPSISGALFVPVDMPFLLSQDLRLLVKKGRASQNLCCFEKCYLPLYCPVSNQILDYLDNRLRGNENKQVTRPDYSIKAMLRELNGLEIKIDDRARLDNINTKKQWQNYYLQQSTART